VLQVCTMYIYRWILITQSPWYRKKAWAIQTSSFPPVIFSWTDIFIGKNLCCKKWRFVVRLHHILSAILLLTCTCTSVCPPELQVLMGSLLYMRQGLQGSPYAFLLDPIYWDEICDTFTRDACALMGMSVESPLSVRWVSWCFSMLNVDEAV